MYALGGAGDTEALCSVERFDRATCEWEPSSSMLECRESCAATAANGMIYVLGGVSRDAQCLASAERFSPSCGRWEAIAPMGCARGSSCGARARSA